MAKNFLSRRSAWAVNSRGLHPGQFAPGGGELRSRLYEPLAHVRGGCTPGNSRLGAVSCAHACTNRWRTCTAGVISQANMPHGSAGQFAPLGPGPQWGPGPTEPAGETLAIARAHRENSARARGLHPGQFAPGGGELRSRLYEPLAHVRGGGIFRTKEPGRQFQGRGAAGGKKSKKRKGRGKRHWPSLFSLRGIIEEGRTCISRKGAVHFF